MQDLSLEDSHCELRFHTVHQVAALFIAEFLELWLLLVFFLF